MAGRGTALAEIETQLAERVTEFAEALPSHIRPEHFQRAAMTALQQNAKLIEVDRRSLFTALKRCAQDGLIPDGREAVLVIYRDRDRGSIAQYQPMIAGIRKLVLQSGEISRFDQQIIYDGDVWDYEEGDNPHIKHRPALDNRGKPILVYSIAQFRDGTLSRDVMSVADVQKRREQSQAKDGEAWRKWWDEMAFKTVAKHHAKRLPMSVEARNALARDDDGGTVMPVLSPSALAASPSSLAATEPDKRPRLVDQFDALSAPTAESETDKRVRGRARKSSSETPDQPADERDETSETVAASLPDAEQTDIEQHIAQQQKTTLPDDNWPGPDVDVPSADYQQGIKDARAGHTGCLNRDIKENPLRFREWQRGYNTAKKA